MKAFPSMLEGFGSIEPNDDPALKELIAENLRWRAKADLAAVVGLAMQKGLSREEVEDAFIEALPLERSQTK